MVGYKFVSSYSVISHGVTVNELYVYTGYGVMSVMITTVFRFILILHINKMKMYLCISDTAFCITSSVVIHC